MFLIGSAIDWKIAIQMGNVNFMFYVSLSLSLFLWVYWPLESMSYLIDSQFRNLT